MMADLFFLSAAQLPIMKDVSIWKFIDLVATTLGLRIREQEEAIFLHKLLKRVQALGLPSLEAYYQLLTIDRQSTIGNAEWQELVRILTINESYFFRDQGQFSLLKNHILPELIQRKQSLSAGANRTIRVWSAGCATGEEAYSLAILLKELIPVDQVWNVLVLGTDINELALEQAKHGVYSDWSFRSVDPELQQKYFRRSRQGWRIDFNIRRMVTFQPGNLVRDCYPSSQTKIHDLDLILCRNVFIYFNKQAIASVLDCFYRTLNPGGCLIVGHTELHGQNLDQFQVKTFPESVLYQRRMDTEINVRAVAEFESEFVTEAASDNSPQFSFKSETLSNTVVPVKAEREQVKTTKPEHLCLEGMQSINQFGPILSPFSLLGEVVQLMERKAYLEAIYKARQVLAQEPQHLRAYCLIAEAYANLGDHLNAAQTCHQILQFAPFAVEPLYLLAQVAQEQGDLEAAKNLLKRVIYLAPTAVYAYFELGCLYEQQGNVAKAQRNWQSALEVLRQTAQQTIELPKSLTVTELQTAAEQKLRQASIH